MKRYFAILYGVWFFALFTGASIAQWWYNTHGASTSPNE